MASQETLKAKYRILNRRREWLEQSIHAYLLPAFFEQGFHLAPSLYLPQPLDREYARSFPSWGRFVRPRESRIDLIEIQLAKHRRAAFRINAGTVPADGLMTFAGLRPAEEVAVHWLPEWFETHARPWLRPVLKALGLEPLGGWFSVWHLPYQSTMQDDYKKLALQAAGVVPELELVLCEGRVERHVRRVVLPSSRRPQPRAANAT